MVRYRGPKKKIINKLGSLPGLTQKSKREQQTLKGSDIIDQKKTKASAYKIRLNEKQKLRYYYGINESQLIKYIKEAKRKKGLTGFLLMQLLEMRLDNILFRLNIVPTIAAARQMVNHGHVLVNKKRVNIPSFQCHPGDLISFKDGHLAKLKKNFSNKLGNHSVNDHLHLDSTTMIGKVNNVIQNHNLSFTVNEMLVVEYYSRLL
uniref:30S ribosomal protein S4 n=1 Tax=Dictyotopsis propagulifera TaxID=670095 RepID=UPI002E75BAFE|nr:30S ribosomal protein S4 [Dictyotopsis propagulifera]WAM63241.1 30S ribosomal protein S4 [Dictyotopsis propagulifera]